MIPTKKLIGMERKWQKIATIGRKRISSVRTNKKLAAANRSNESSAVDKGFFVIYTIDERRFVIPLAFLGNPIFLELFKMSEEEFGLSSDGPIMFPCDPIVMNHVVSLVKTRKAKDLERAVLNSITKYRCLSDTSANRAHPEQQSALVCGF